MKKANIPEISMPIERWSFSNSDFHGYQFALYIRENHRYMQLTSFDSCRENLIDNVIEYYEESPYKPRLLDVRHTRLLVGRKESWLEVDPDNKTEEDILRGLKIIHHFERIAKWPLCRLYRVIDEKLGADEKVYALKGNKRWQRSPYMLSLFALLVRLGRMQEFGKFRTHMDFIRICESLSKKKWILRGITTKSTAWCYDLAEPYYDLRYIKPEFYLKLRILMKHFYDIFGRRSARHHFLLARGKEDCYIGAGIADFCRNNIEDKTIARRFKKVCKKYSV